MLRDTKKLQDNPYYTVQFFSNLSRNGIAKQVAEKIAQCNRAFKLVLLSQTWATQKSAKITNVVTSIT